MLLIALSLTVRHLGHHTLWILRLRVGLHLHRRVLRRERHLLRLHLVRLLHHWSLILISLEVPILDFNLWELI